jgi:hypothetical protein
LTEDWRSGFQVRGVVHLSIEVHDELDSPGYELIARFNGKTFRGLHRVSGDPPEHP